MGEVGELHDREPELPKWITDIEDYQNSRNGFLQFLELGDSISERDLLDGDKYPWLGGYSLAFILVASHDHHQEHLEKLLDWLRKH